jgi:eukaryotic-like serine/threonine-protein kinase
VFVSPANKNLRDTLVRLNLCSDRDFRRCRRVVRKLARGIPSFDFVWIDALVQLGSLTSYQAKILQSAPAEQLCVGPCVLLERLGAGSNSETYRARIPAGETVALKRVRVPVDESTSAAVALRDCIEKTRCLDSPFVVPPHSFAEQPGVLVVLSRYVAGPSCKELLVRRGRFAADVVAEIARQLAHGCGALEARSLLHGQIRLDNVRITSAGQAVLVDAGIGNAFGSEVLIRDDISAEAYDGIAPERIGTGNSLTTASEIYAFGCLLWQLLAGRPPFPTADPLAKLAAHQSNGVPDVRTLAPDVPANLAEAVRACTHPDPAQRPSHFAEIARRFGPPNANGRQRLARFLRHFDSAAPPDQLTPVPPMRFPTTAVALLLFVLSGAAFFLLRHGATAELLRVGNGSANGLAATAERPAAPPKAQAKALRPLPPPNAEGVIALSEDCYEAETVTYAGDLMIRGTGGQPATIVVSDGPFRTSCRKLAMTHVVVRCESKNTPSALMVVRSQELALNGCAFSSASGRTEESDAAVVWTMAPARDPDAGRIRLTNTVFSGAGTAVRFASPPTRIEIDNCLKQTGGFLHFGERGPDRDLTVVAEHLTLRRAAWMCRMSSPPGGRAAGQLRLVLRDSAFDLAGPGAALVRLISPFAPKIETRPILISGRESVICPDVSVVAWSKSGEAAARPIDACAVVVEGLAVGEFRFIGPAGASPADSSIDRQSLAVPRQSEEPPGIVASRLASVFGRDQAAR